MGSLTAQPSIGHRQLSKEIKDETVRSEVIAAMEKEVASSPNPNTRTPAVNEAGSLLLDLVKNGNPTPERVSAIENALLKLEPSHRSTSVGWCYYVGIELDAAGKKKEADKFWRRALIDPSRDNPLAILAGAKLAGHNGTARPDSDPLTADDLWPPKEK
jgi:hypothetical protein